MPSPIPFIRRITPVALVASGFCVSACANDQDEPTATMKSAVVAAKTTISAVGDPAAPACIAKYVECTDARRRCVEAALNPEEECSALWRQCESVGQYCDRYGSGHDASAAPVYVRVKTCTTSEATYEHEGIDCLLEPEFALVGGGAQTVTSATANGTTPVRGFLTESRPLADGRTWRASSRDHRSGYPHNLVVYAIGMRLEGVHTQRLRDVIKWKEITLPGNTAAVQFDAESRLISGGAKAMPSTQHGAWFLNRTRFTGYHEWQGGSTRHLDAASGTTSVWMLEIADKIIEGFGALEIRQLIAHSNTRATGLSTSSVELEPGWALIGMGGAVDQPTGAGRLLVSIAPGNDNRSMSVTSSDYVQSGGGTTTAYAIMARKVPGSHGLCNPGTALQPQLDRCVADICRQHNECCSSNWDSHCVDLVEPICGRSCAEYTCVPTVFEPERWNHNFGTPENPIYRAAMENDQANCGSYALNQYGKTKIPGDTLNLLPSEAYDWLSVRAQFAFSEGEGLIPIPHNAACYENRTKVWWSGHGGDFHWRRQDSDGRWSEKWALGTEAYLSENFAPGFEAGNTATFCACDLPLPATGGPR
ncbi:MAG TPA: hypothetical protein VIV60_33695 [Polyangiaceae bacterium]